jgi:hypothetical protein
MNEGIEATASDLSRATFCAWAQRTKPLDLPRDEAIALAELIKLASYEDCLRRSNRLKRYSQGREEVNVTLKR